MIAPVFPAAYATGILSRPMRLTRARSLYMVGQMMITGSSGLPLSSATPLLLLAIVGCLSETSGDTLQAVMLHWCQHWAPTYTLLGGVEPQGTAIVIPGGLARLATVLVFTPGALTAQLIPRVISFRRIHTFLRRLVAGSIRIRMPPSLRVSEHGPDADVILRDGDAFEAYHDASHASYRPGQQVPTVAFAHLPHYYAWHLPFRVAQGGWARIWSADFREGRASEKTWITKGAVWAPHWCQLQPPGTLPGPDRWVPAVGAEDDCCHLEAVRLGASSGPAP